jgi:hypothetical protein
MRSSLAHTTRGSISLVARLELLYPNGKYYSTLFYNLGSTRNHYVRIK